jgi:putative oxidoreductase
MSYGVLFLRFALGLTVAAHGAQKLFGSFGAHGPRGTGGFFSAIGFRAQLQPASEEKGGRRKAA